jgi:uncharacterized membrane-anchored protein YjiN (DUF445 family)
VEAWWHDLLTNLKSEAEHGDAALAERIARVVQAAGQQLLSDADLRATVSEHGQRGLLRVLDDSRDAILDFVTQRVRAWDAAEMSEVLEQHIGRDLQFIRINGTLVGALVGLLLHAATQAALVLPAVQRWMLA